MRFVSTRSFAGRSLVSLLSIVVLGTGLAVPLAVSTAVTAAAITPRAESDQRGAANPAEAQRVNCDAGARIPVNCATGNLWETTTELAVTGRGRALAFERTYNALAAATATSTDALGWGWTHSYATKLVVDGTTGDVTVTQGNGATVTFTPSGGTYTAPQWVLAALVHNADGTWTFTLPDQRADHFDSSGRLISQTDRNGYVTSLAYVAGQLASVTDPAGRSLTFTYDASGRLMAVADPLGRTVGFGYDGTGNLTSVINPARHVTSYGYDGVHRLTASTDRNGATTTVAYDASNRVVTQTDPLARTTTIGYSGATTTVTDPAGNITTRTFDVQGNLTAMTRGATTPLAATWTYGYDTTKGQRTSTTDPNGHTSSATWDTRGNRLSATDGLSRTTTATYNALNEPLTVTDAMGVTTTFSYDAAGNVLSQSTPLVGSSPAVAKTTSYTYGDAAHPGDVTAMTDPNGKVWSQTWDNVGNLTAVTDPLGNRTTYGSNAIGWRTSTTSPRGNEAGAVPAAFTTTVTYNALGNPTAVTDPMGGRTVYGYDNNQNPVTETDPNGHTTTSVYNAADERTQVIRPDGSGSTTTYTGAGDVATQTDGLGHTTTFTYNALRRLVSTADPLGRTTSFGYDPAGNQVTKADPAGTCPSWPINPLTLSPTQQCTVWRYDNADQLIGIDYSDPDTHDVGFTYDANGRRLTMADGSSSTYTYDSLGRLTSAARAGHTPIAYGYDLAGHVTSIGYPVTVQFTLNGTPFTGTGTASRTYDAAGRMASVTDWFGHTTTFGYDADSNLTGKTFPNGVVSITTYDGAGAISNIQATDPNGAPLVDLSYGRDSKGQLTTVQSSLTAAVRASYAYDPADRLTTVSGVAGPTATTMEGYGYDPADRLTRINVGGVDAELHYDIASQLTTTTSPGGTTTFSYDTKGNRLQSVDDHGNSRLYRYDQAGNLVNFTGPAVNRVNQTVLEPLTAEPNLVTVNYAYDGDGRRADLAWDLAEGRDRILVDSLATYALTTGYVNAYLYGPDGLPIERLDPAGNATYYLQDQVGSTVALTDTQGHVVQAYLYDPYGNSTATTTVANPIQYAGQYTDPASGLMYTQGRWYDPMTGQFLTSSSPSVVGSPYVYAGDNPINVEDHLAAVHTPRPDGRLYDLSLGRLLADEGGPVWPWVTEARAPSAVPTNAWDDSFPPCKTRRDRNRNPKFFDPMTGLTWVCTRFGSAYEWVAVAN